MSSGDQGSFQMVVLGGIYFKGNNHCKEILSSLGLLTIGRDLEFVIFKACYVYRRRK